MIFLLIALIKICFIYKDEIVNLINSEEEISLENQEIENTEDKEKSAEATAVEPIVQTPMPMKKKAFKVVEIKEIARNLLKMKKLPRHKKL